MTKSRDARVSEAFSDFKDFLACQEFKEKQQQRLPKKTASFASRNRTGKGKGPGRGSSIGLDNSNEGKTPGSPKRQRPQEQPKPKFTSGGNRHRPRRRSFWLSDTEIDMGAFSAPHAKRVSWSTLARRPQLNPCAHRQCQRRRHPRLRTEFCREVTQIHPCGQATEFFLLQRPDPEASPCIGMLGATCAQIGMFVRFGAVFGVRSCRLVMKKAFTPTFV